QVADGGGVIGGRTPSGREDAYPRPERPATQQQAEEDRERGGEEPLSERGCRPVAPLGRAEAVVELVEGDRPRRERDQVGGEEPVVVLLQPAVAYELRRRQRDHPAGAELLVDGQRQAPPVLEEHR